MPSLAPSTRVRIFWKTHLFLSVLGSHPHGDGIFGHRKRSFSKTLSRVDLFENAVFLLSCGRVKTELFENADVTASIYHQSEHVLGSLGITRGHVACLFSFIEVLMSNIITEYRILLSNCEFPMSQRFRVDRDIFENGPRVDAVLFSYG